MTCSWLVVRTLILAETYAQRRTSPNSLAQLMEVKDSRLALAWVNTSHGTV